MHEQVHVGERKQFATTESADGEQRERIAIADAGHPDVLDDALDHLRARMHERARGGHRTVRHLKKASASRRSKSPSSWRSDRRACSETPERGTDLGSRGSLRLAERSDTKVNLERQKTKVKGRPEQGEPQRYLDLDLRPAQAAFGQGVRISKPSSVTAIVCSHCADSEWSRVTTVQPSGSRRVLRLAGVDHRLDRERHALFEAQADAAVPVVQHLRIFVIDRADAVPAVFAHDRETVALDVILDRVRRYRRASRPVAPGSMPCIIASNVTVHRRCARTSGLPT